MKLLKYILQYISRTWDLGLKFDKKVDILDNMIGYVDFNIAKSKKNQKLIKGYVFMLAKTAMSYSSRFLLIVILSIYEIKYIVVYKIR